MRRVRARVADWVSAVAIRSPSRLAVGAFALLIVVTTVALQTPLATRSGERAPAVDSLFTATSSVTVTGLVTVDTAGYWSPFGQLVILLGIQIGGLGIMTVASLLGIAVSRRLGLAGRVALASESGSVGLGDVRAVLRVVAWVTLTVESLAAIVLFTRFLDHGLGAAKAAWYAVFYSVSAFNNAGFVPNQGYLPVFADDPGITMTIALGFAIGGLGFPVFFNVLRNLRRPRDWSLHTKLTLVTSAILWVLSFVVVLAFEWGNKDTLGAHGVGRRLTDALFTSATERTAGFNVIDHGAMTAQTQVFEMVSMFIGAGSAGTAGGIRVSTLAVLVLAIAAEVRGRRDIESFRKRIGTATLRVAVAVASLAIASVLVGTMALLALSDADVGAAAYEVVSAFATCGLSLGITEGLPDPAKLVLVLVMFVGRLGGMTLAAGLALRRERRVIRFPSERPIIG